MNEVWQTIGHWIQVHKWIQWVFSGVGLLAFSFLAWLWKRRMSDEKPQILFERSGLPYGGHPHPLVRGKRIDALYKFKIKNAGHQAAVLGDNPFRAIDYKEVYRRTLKKRRMPRIMVAIPEGQVVPNVLEPGMSFNLDIALGHFGKKAMSDPFSFRVYYTNVKGHRYRTTVKIRPQSGDVVTLRQMRLGLISGLFM